MHRTSLFITALLLAGCNAAAPPRLIANPGGPAILPLTPPARQSCGLPERFDVLPVAMAGRQPLVKIAMDSATATMVLDTGANSTVVTSAFASRFNARAAQPAQQVITQGVDGRTAVRRGFVETLGMGTATLRGVNVNITPATLGPPAQPLDGLLGLDLLGLYDADIDLAGGRVKLYRGKLCPEAESPWKVPAFELKARRAAGDGLLGAAELAADRADQRPAKLEVPVVLNGKIIWALIDTGATNTIVREDIAASVGVTPAMLAADPVGRTFGSGGGTAVIHLHRFDSIRIAGETEPDPRLLIGPLPPGTAMLLGADYLLKHRVWLSYATARVFVARGKVED